MVKETMTKMALAFAFVALGLTGCGGGGSSSSSGGSSDKEVVEPEVPEDEAPIEEPTPEPGAPENYALVKSLTVHDEKRVAIDSGTPPFQGPFVGLSESGEALAVWVTSRYDVLGGTGWASTLHTMTGDFSTKSWAAEQTLSLPMVKSLKVAV